MMMATEAGEPVRIDPVATAYRGPLPPAEVRSLRKLLARALVAC
jgi:hypothetical protein